jgi:hypothetical protein
MARMVPLKGLSSSVAGGGIMIQGRGGQQRAYQMTGIDFQWRLTYKTPGSAPERIINKFTKEINKQVLRQWHEEFRPKHFLAGAGSVYHYQRRTVATMVRKRKKYGHNRPIVMRGLTYIALGQIRRLTSTSRTGRLLMRGPWYVGHQRRSERTGKLSPHLPSEIKYILPSEALAMARHGSKILAQNVKDWKRRTVRP